MFQTTYIIRKFYSEYAKTSQNSIIRKQIKKWAQALDKHFLKGEDGKHMKLRSTNYSPSESN